jgi:hypothetical protein
MDVKTEYILIGLAVFVLAYGLFVWLPDQDGEFDFSVGDTGEEDDGRVLVDDNIGDAATVTLNAYDKAADTETEVYPTWTVVDDANGNKVVNDGAANSTTLLVVGDTLNAYGTGTTYYCPEPVIGFEVDKVQKTVNLDCYTAATDSTMSLKIYDDSMDELTADDNASNEADYSLALGSSEEQVLYIKLSNDDSDSAYPLGAFCTYASGNTDDFEIVDSDYEEIPLPEEVDDATPTVANDAATDKTGDYKHCYKPVSGDYLLLEEWEDTGFVKAKVTAGSTEPAANAGDNFGVIAIDHSWNVFADGSVQGGIHDGTDDEDVGNMGAIDEGTELADAFGKDIVACVEGQ